MQGLRSECHLGGLGSGRIAVDGARRDRLQGGLGAVRVHARALKGRLSAARLLLLPPACPGNIL